MELTKGLECHPVWPLQGPQVFCKELLMGFSNDGKLSTPAAHTLAFPKPEDDGTAPPAPGSDPSLADPPASPAQNPRVAVASPTRGKCRSCEGQRRCQVHGGGEM